MLKASPSSLPVLDTLTQGGHTDPIGWCGTCPTGARPPHSRTTSISLSPAPLCGPLQTPGAAPRTISSHTVINACLLQKGQTIPRDGRWGRKGRTAGLEGFLCCQSGCMKGSGPCVSELEIISSS